MIKPLKDRVLIQKNAVEETNAAGIEIVSHAKTSRNTTVSQGTVVAVAVDSELEVGNVVVFDEGYGNEVEPDTFLIKEKDVLAYVS